MTTHARAFALCAALVCGMTSCEKAEQTFSELPARFVETNLIACPPLYTAVNNMGQWCTIQAGNNTYIAKGASQSIERPLTAMTNYQGMYLGIAGLIIGLPNIPDTGNDLPTLKCYDLACPNCYAESHIGRALTVAFDRGTATCGRCSRVYNLNSIGESGEGDRLERYKVSCNGQQLVVSN